MQRRWPGALTSDGGSGRRQDVDGPPAVGPGLAAMPNDTTSPPRVTVCEPSWLVSCAQGPAHRCESHASAGEHKARMGTGNVRFFLRISTTFSICRMLISRVHCLCEAATRGIPHHKGHDLRASHALTSQGEWGTVPRLLWFSPRARGSRYAVSRLRHRPPSHGAPGSREKFLSPVPQCLVRLGDSMRSSSVHASCPPPLPVADSGTLQHGLRASQSVGGRTPHVLGHPGARPS